MIRVEKDAQKTNAYQENRNLLLSKTAHADSIPGLEILANDVRCTHGATLGQVDREQLFYLMTRGLSRAGGRAADRARLLPGRARPDRARAGARSARCCARGTHPPGLTGLDGWERSERVLDSGGLESRQLVLVDRAVEASEAGARWLGLTYWQAVDSFTRGAVRASWGDQGGRLRLLGGATLLRFGLPELRYSDAIVSCRYAIEGGLLALRPGGSVTLAQRVEGTGTSSGSRSRSTCRGWRHVRAPRGGPVPCTQRCRARSTRP